ncbi:hypothetical protein BDV96DRAFT_209322 [Lophiotrema nucula]|uniref:Uncharacterized protein n=1 Tax=Lophiotrema nucula TaxID=690887 RepID=A0A6A5ZNR9_9PLEO|nr:hypothetical protein BDV96DRAFT_209322 [Lophiotrema nucula]
MSITKSYRTLSKAQVYLDGNGVEVGASFVHKSKSTSYFAQHRNFEPIPNAPFNDEFDRLVSSQDWTREEAREQKARATEEELGYHYGFTKKEEGVETSEKEEQEPMLKGYQALCDELGKPKHDTVLGCIQELKREPFFNIIDVIDARRTGKPAKGYTDFDDFASYTLEPGKCLDRKMIHQTDGKILQSLLQDFTWGPQDVHSPRFIRSTKSRYGLEKERHGGVRSGRVSRKYPRKGDYYRPIRA